MTCAGGAQSGRAKGRCCASVPYLAQAAEHEKLQWLDGGVVRIMLDGAKTDGELMIHRQATRGESASPVLVHDREDETIVLLQGSGIWWVGDQALAAVRGRGRLPAPQRPPRLPAHLCCCSPKTTPCPAVGGSMPHPPPTQTPPRNQKAHQRTPNSSDARGIPKRHDQGRPAGGMHASGPPKHAVQAADHLPGSRRLKE